MSVPPSILTLVTMRCSKKPNSPVPQSVNQRIVIVEPRGPGMALFTLRAAAEVRAPQFGSAEGDLDAEMVAIAGAIIRQRSGNFDPSTTRRICSVPRRPLRFDGVDTARGVMVSPFIFASISCCNAS